MPVAFSNVSDLRFYVVSGSGSSFAVAGLDATVSAVRVPAAASLVLVGLAAIGVASRRSRVSRRA